MTFRSRLVVLSMAAALGLTLAPASFAEDYSTPNTTSKDTMSKDTVSKGKTSKGKMSKTHMKKDGMKKDETPK